MLLGFNSVSFTTTEARAQAGDGGGGDRAVTITATSDTPGITVTGPIEEGFDEGVSAFIVEFTPPDPGDEPPEHASVAITIAPEDGWTLQQPDPANLPITLNTARGTAADDIEWQAVRFVQGMPEDEAMGTVRVVWPWAEFTVSSFKVDEQPAFAFPHKDKPDERFHVGIGIEVNCTVTISIIPDSLPQIIKNKEAGKWRSGWIQNVRSVGRTLYYSHRYYVVWWQTAIKPDLPILDTVTPRDPHSDPRWYMQQETPLPFFNDGDQVSAKLRDIPQMELPWFWDPDDEDNPGDPMDRRAVRINLVDQFRSWLVGMRGQGDDAVIEWVHWMDWQTDLRVDVEWSGGNKSLAIDEDKLYHHPLQDGKGGIVPDLTLPTINEITKLVPNEY